MAPSVDTSRGRVLGTEVRGIRTFKGIPYARPPVGVRRFMPPEPAEPWTGVLKATRPGPVPIQAAVPGLRFLNAGVARQSEDCLYLNVWTPGLGDARRPVLVWIHGGGFLIGSGSTPVYDGSMLAARGDLVVVTLNYRLGALGFVHLDGVCGSGFEEASNPGTRDQIAALEWVRENIERFGGDPGNVTVFGQSAGAMSIAALLAAPKARPLFHRAILQSAAGRMSVSREEADNIGELFLHALGDPRRTPRVLGELPVEKILRAQGVVNRKMMSLADLMVMLPAVDGRLITERPADAIRNGRLADRPLMVGTTLEEWKLFSAIEAGLPTLSEEQLVARFHDLLPLVMKNAPEAEVAANRYREAVRSRGGRTTPFEVWSAFQTARVFHRPAAELATGQAQAGGDVYSYLFTWHPPALGRTLGAFHAIELPFVFGLTTHPATRPFTGFATAVRRLSGRMQHAWIEFARHGNPGHDRLPEWDRYDGDARATMLFNRECSIADRPLEAEHRLLEEWS
ncbi:MAG: carboxylesterase/lipase family protein [Deltaproteobacteria bacterium]|nr:carboxylesterase/lipase family protein [Deltaproteobacteria bacterium]MBW2697092.1 carboxylesterase/lipase family protein [Deltaproteobacteria bacterium]